MAEGALPKEQGKCWKSSLRGHQAGLVLDGLDSFARYGSAQVKRGSLGVILGSSISWNW